ncbi:MAG: ComF family protein [Oscillospiraceae bacterium]
MKKYLSKCKAFILDIFFPNRCPFCDEFICWDKHICNDCMNSLVPANDKICRTCGKEKCCCHDSKLNYDAVFASFFYDDKNVSKAVYSFKHQGIINIAEYTAFDAYRRIKNGNIAVPDMIVPVPMSKRKRRSRGHNQAELLGVCIGEKLDIPVRNNLLYKKDTEDEQHIHTAAERIQRVKGLFYCGEEDLSGKSVLLCDDVMTTGATLNECAGLLKSMGAEKVIAVVCAASRLDNSQEKGA